MTNLKVKQQSIGEEIANAISHGMGALLSIAATVIAIVYAAFNSDTISIVAACLYGLSLTILYTASTIYHALTNKKAKAVFRILDHCSIFILILGTYIPLCLSLLRNEIGWILLTVLSACAATGIVFNSINLHKYRKLSMILYILMGWSALFVSYLIIKKVDLYGIILLLSGGLSYTGGIFFYKNHQIKFFHFIWHFFVIAGSVFHYFFVLFYCL